MLVKGLWGGDRCEQVQLVHINELEYDESDTIAWFQEYPIIISRYGWL